MDTIKKGSSCPDVLYLQRFLGLSVDGAFGPKTEEAVKTWQSSKGLTPDGIVGPKSWSMIMSETREPISIDSWKSLSERLGCQIEVLKAIKTVETGSTGPYLKTSGRPTILFEAHLFWSNLKRLGINPVPLQKSHPGILSPSWNRALYKGGEQEYVRLQEAWGISAKAAIMSVSWGFPQILAQNFKDPFGFVADSYMSEVKQLEYFGKFLEANGFKPYLVARDWAGIARKYNGPGFAKNKYDQKLLAAYKKLIG